ncbi:MAG: gamma-glutamylcyclotransferase family protein [Bryobacteraceae bacterium]
MDHLFVYGTLRCGSKNKFARMLADGGQFVGRARVAGRLYDLGRYPGAVPSDEADCWVDGEVWRLDDPQLLPLLDEYEGSEFERAIVSVQTENAFMDCSLYWYVGPATGRLIGSGNWLKR